MNKEAMLGDIKQIFSELTYEQKLVYTYGYLSSSELEEEFSYSVEDACAEDLRGISEYLLDIKGRKNG